MNDKNLRMKKLFTTLLLLCFSFTLLGQTVPENNITTIIVIRHAEKSDDGTSDPSLSSDGLKRATRLANYFNYTKVDQLFATPYKRTRETLSVIAVNKKLDVITYNPSDKMFFAEFLTKQKGKTSIIAGHSNTAPIIVNDFIKVNTYPQIPDSEYGKMWILTFDAEKLIDCLLLDY